MLIDALILLSPSIAIGGLLFLRSTWRRRRQAASYRIRTPQKAQPDTAASAIKASRDMEDFRRKAAGSLAEHSEVRHSISATRSDPHKLRVERALPTGSRAEPPLTQK